ncbi:MAG: DUF7507 domain-containing protein [Candidatus Promineifilaceae bacterium]
MRKRVLLPLLALAVALALPLVALAAGGWSDDFDSYPTGQDLHGVGGWKGWDNNPAFTAFTSDAQALSAPNSVDIAGPSDLVQEYAGYTTGNWTYTAWQYIPSTMSGLTYFILLNTYNDGGPNNWSVQVNFDAAANLVVNDGASGGTLPLLEDQWVELRVEINLDADTQSFYYGDALLFAGSWTNEVSGGGILNINAVDLFANSATSVYYDDMSLAAAGGAPPTINVDPDTLEQSQPPDEVNFQSLDITNLGNEDLAWTIVEEGPTVVLNGSSAEGPVAELAASGAGAPVGPGTVPPDSEGGVNLVLDDGTAENSIGLTAGGEFIWLNRFTPAAAEFPFTLEEIQVLWTTDTGCAVGNVMDVYVYQDADNNPANGADFVGSATGQTIQVLDAFSVYPVSIAVSGPGDVLIAVVNRDCDAAGQFPAALDQTASQVRSWVGIYAGPPADPPVLPAPTFGTIDSFGFPGNWMIRGSGTVGGGGEPCAPSDTPWLSADPTAGTTTPGATSPVTVTFDSAGLAQGVYTSTLCIESNDPQTPQVRVPVTLTVTPPPDAPSIVLTKTVGTDPNACATTDTIQVPAGGGGAQVTYCYTVMNTGNVTFTLHDLVDDQLGVILTDFPYVLGPGASAFLTETTVITQDTTNTATWTAEDDGGVNVAVATDTATVDQLPPTSVALSGFGEGPSSRNTLVIALATGTALLAAGTFILKRNRAS